MNNNIKMSIFLVIMILFSAVALSAQQTGTLNLSGTVPGILEVTVTPEAGAANMDLSIDAANLKVATVTERSNKKAGFTVSIESANAAAGGGDAPFFKNTDPEVSSNLGYTITYGGNTISFTGGSATVSDTTVKTSGTGTVNDVAINYNGASEFPYEGTYTDILTFTIAAK